LATYAEWKFMATRVIPASSVLALIEAGGLGAVFQPIVELETGATAGYEALARGPRGSDLEMPATLFGAAVREGVLSELDRACRRTALEAAKADGLPPSKLLFLNAEPATIDTESMSEPALQGGHGPVSVVIEMTERALTARPSEVLAAVRVLREHNCRIALDDVGADRRSLALMPFLAPDVIKLDIGLTQGSLPREDAARVLTAVGAEAERSGAVVLAEGIETEEHLRRAEAMGATLGQGWLFGRPGPLPQDFGDATRAAIPRTPLRTPSGETPFQRVASRRPTRRADKEMLLALSRHLEHEAATLVGEAVVAAAFQDASFFTDDTRRGYEELAEDAALVCAIGPGMSEAPGKAVRGAALANDDPMNGEWIVTVVGPHFAAALVARETEGGGADDPQRFEHCLTYDRTLVVEATDQLLRRVLRSG
jgi:EAL domain-containing protein (putative c-di-GMP-specific phosphodiesterase class I)